MWVPKMSSDPNDQDFVTVRFTYDMWEIESNSVGNGSERSPVPLGNRVSFVAHPGVSTELKWSCRQNPSQQRPVWTSDSNWARGSA